MHMVGLINIIVHIVDRTTYNTNIIKINEYLESEYKCELKINLPNKL